MIFKHSISYLSCESIFKTPPEKYISAILTICNDVVPVYYVSDTCCTLTDTKSTEHRHSHSEEVLPCGYIIGDEEDRFKLSEEKGHDAKEWSIIVANRGRSWEWDTRETVKPYVKCVRCDRKKPLSASTELIQTVNKISHVDVVLDFSGYKRAAVEETIQLLQGKVGIYIYISSDSVYEVCDNKPHSGPTRETDDVRPVDKTKRKHLSRQDSYGHKKLECEEQLLSSHADGKLPVLILRLADVIGERDPTHRWWQQQLWLRLAQLRNTPVCIPKENYKHKISVVYGKDVADLICDVMELSPSIRGSLTGQAFNIACNETFTVKSMLENIAREMKVDVDKLDFRYTSAAPHIYPSVERGPIDTSKAVKMLHWTPTPWPIVCKRVTAFYENIARESIFTDEKEDCINSLLEDVDNSKERTQLKIMLNKVLSMTNDCGQSAESDDC